MVPEEIEGSKGISKAFPVTTVWFMLPCPVIKCMFRTELVQLCYSMVRSTKAALGDSGSITVFAIGTAGSASEQ